MASQVLRYQSETMQWSVRLIVYAVFGYLGMMLAMRSSRDEFSLIIPYVRFARETTQHEPLVVDTNVIIDGRISDLCATGFLSRSLIVPRFVWMSCNYLRIHASRQNASAAGAVWKF